MQRPIIVCAASVEGRGVADALLGVGKTSAAMRTTELIMNGRPPWLLLIGVCGAYPASASPGNHGLSVRDLCLVSADTLMDEGVELPGGDFRGIAALGLGEAGPFHADVDRTAAIADSLGIPVVTGATVSACSGDDARSRVMAARGAGAQVESMEGAAVLQVCHHFEVPAVQLRCVSNLTGDRAAAGWDLHGAADALHEAVRTLTRAYGWTRGSMT